ncbi:MAG: DUF134 domain-containing protein [Deltaproteobacteria bacterium]|nr:DUF134 domain-containing protein [Deltaproteobacteria bacterium]
MPRPCCPRRIQGSPRATVYKPVGIPLRDLEEVVVTLDEFEAIRLADLGGLYQEAASEEMKVSRTTFSRIVDAAHRKIADAIVHGKAIRIDGGTIENEQEIGDEHDGGESGSGSGPGRRRRYRCCREHDL